MHTTGDTLPATGNATRCGLVRQILSELGENPDREGLRDTPRRFWEAWQYYTSGYDVDPEDVLRTFADGSERYDEIVFQGCIPIWSMCEHHLAPFFGVAHIGYLPEGRIVGLSKLARLLEIYARRITVQERITTQVADALMEHLGARAAGVVLRCRHSCMESRGIEKSGTMTYTSALRGMFKDDTAIRAEFLAFVSRADAKA